MACGQSLWVLGASPRLAFHCMPRPSPPAVPYQPVAAVACAYPFPRALPYSYFAT